MYVAIQKLDFFREKNGDFFSMGYLDSIMF